VSKKTTHSYQDSGGGFGNRLPKNSVRIARTVACAADYVAISSNKPGLRTNEITRQELVQIDITVRRAVPEQGVVAISCGFTVAIADLLRAVGAVGRRRIAPAGIQIDITCCRAVPEQGVQVTSCGWIPATAARVKGFLEDLGVDTLFVEPGSPWENGYVESFNSRMRDELLDGELFLHIDEMKYVVERWRMDYNHYRPHSSLGYMTPAGCAELCRQAGCIRPHTPVLHGVQDCGILS